MADARTDVMGAPPPCGADLTVRPMRSPADYAACVSLQEETWGSGYDVVPVTLLKIVQRIGGIVIGAFNAADGLEGFVFGITGVERARLVHWSHMLAVRPGTRGGGLGRRLKEAQRDALRPLGVERIYWTYDPLVSRNAHLNLVRLGVEVVEYVPDMYGASGSPLHRGLGTDRFVVAWHIGGDQAPRRPAPTPPPGAADAPVVNVPFDDEPGDGAASVPPAAPVVRVEVPHDIERVQRTSLELAGAWRRSTRRAFQRYLAHGYRVAGFYCDTGAERSYYVLAARHTTS